MSMSTRTLLLGLMLYALCAPGCSGPKESPLRVLGRWHTVQEGDSAQSIAAKWGIRPDTLAELNDIPLDAPITKRDEIFIPLNAGLPPGNGQPRVNRTPPSGVSASDATATQQCGTDDRPCYEWPAEGTLATLYNTGNGHHDGIDIAGKEGSDILAAEAGVVLYSGDAIKGYGNLILIKHTDGLITVYAHNQTNLVAEGSTVVRGQKIARMGKSGAAASVHLHFEVRKGETPLNPELYLPKRKD